jgi:hypothetical protein
MLVLLRNSMQVLPSYHLRMLYILAGDVEDFATAWALQDVRARGEHVPLDARPAPLTPALRAQLSQTLADDVEQLGMLLGRDLSHWITEERW